MSLASGTRLGPYEIDSLTGAGGMGEVYRARDTRLNRTVAIKVLPAELAADTGRRERFEREGQAISALNHPHICTLYDIGEQETAQGPVHFLVMEHLEGESLAARLTRGALPMDQVLRYGIEIADAVDQAHRKGITHRDLKPGNIMLTKPGAKVLDFGLARLRGEHTSVPIDSVALTQDAPLTGQGTILGTLPYMAPQQLEGKEADVRTDIFALGAVLYEMATGRKAFEAKSQARLIAAILKEDPRPIRELKPLAPPSLDRLVRKCLAKDPDDRWQTAHDLADELKWIAESGSEVSAAQPPHRANSKGGAVGWRRALPWTLFALALGFAALTLWAPFRRPAPPASPLRLSVELGADVSLDRTDLGPAAILSPDGRLLAFVARRQEGERPQLFVRRLDQLQAAPLPGTDGAHGQFFSPDGQSMAFFADGQLKRVAISGGASVVLADAPGDRGGTWSEDGTILFAPNWMASVGLSRVSAAGGATEVLTRPDPTVGEVTHRWPQALPGGKAVLFTAHRTNGNFDDASIVVQSIPDGPRKVVIQGGYHGRYLPSGHVVYMHEGTLFAIPFNLARLEVAGAAVPVIEEVVGASISAGAQFAFSNRGTLVYLSGRSGNRVLSAQWLDRTGKLSPLRALPALYRFPQFSPDGTKLAVMVWDGKTSDIWVYEWGRDTMSRLTFDVSGVTVPVWCTDGRGIVFNSSRGNMLGNLYWRRADGTGEAQLLTESKNVEFATSWHPSGRHLAFTEMSPQTGADVMILPIEGDEASGLKPGQPTSFLNSSFNEWQAAFSPNGEWLAYSSNESGRGEVYVRPFPGPGGKWQISTGGGAYPTWSRNGRELFYETLDHRLMVVSYAEQAGSLNADKPRLWCETRLPELYGQRAFDLHPDGQRFAVLEDAIEPREEKRDKVVMFLNFFDELRRLAPTR